MVETPWHLRMLALPPYADLPAVRRAYARTLRGIDPAADPEGFARLRSAYEAARAWCEQPPVDTSEPIAIEAAIASSHAPPPPPTTEHGESPPEPAPPTDEADARREAALLTDAFVAEANLGTADDAVAALDGTVASLRTRYVDAPGEFEERLVVLLANGALPHRATLFEAGVRLFHWEDVGQTVALGSAGQWIEQVFTERNAWMMLAASRREQWLALIARASLPLEPRLVRYWPEIEKLCAHYPLWIGLHLDTSVRDGWRDAFDALPPSTKDDYRKSGATAEAYRPVVKKPRRRFQIPGYGLWLIAWLAFQLVKAVVGAYHDSPVNDTPGTCLDLYHQLSRADAYEGLAADEIRELKDRGEWCLRNGYWQEPNGPRR